MVNTEVLTEAVTNSPSLGVKLEQLADQGFVPAASLAAKLSIAQRDFEKFEKYVPLVPEVLLKSKRAGIFDSIDTVEKMTNIIVRIFFKQNFFLTKNKSFIILKAFKVKKCFQFFDFVCFSGLYFT